MTISENDKLIGIDLGGTKVNVGRIENGKIVEKKYRFIPADSDDQWDVINLIIKTVKELLVDGINGIGIGIPSIVDRKKGIVYDVQNIKAWKEVHLKEILEKEFQLPVYLDNDANCFALGEYRFGAGKGCKSIVGLTIGTGMGAGIINDGYLLKDANGGAGEFGMIPYLDADYERYCSGQFFKNNYNNNGEVLAERAKKGDLEALEVFNQFGQHLGNAIKMIMYAIDPEKIIIGGSVAKSHKLFEKAMYQSIKNFAFQTALKSFKIEFSNTSDIAILGAASLHYDEQKKLVYDLHE
ncbi:MAG: ROK family protein [Chloroflexia bacterium]|nr:ROK family protein [Chloroflexia bacterium]